MRALNVSAAVGSQSAADTLTRIYAPPIDNNNKDEIEREDYTMKAYTEILKDIASARAGMVDTAKTEKDLTWDAMLSARKSGTDAEFNAAKAAYKAAEEKYVAECRKNEDLQMTAEILKDNAAQAFFTENIETICNVWNKYAGKPHGEKTAEKIRKELFATLGVRVWISNKYSDACITCYFDTGAPFRSLEFCAIRTNGEAIPALIGNKIQSLSPEVFRVYNCGAYVDDAPAHVQAIREAHDKAREAEAAFAAAVSDYNALTRGGIIRASTREGVKRWFLY